MSNNDTVKWLQKHLEPLLEQREEIQTEDYPSKKEAGAARAVVTRKINKIQKLIDHHKRFC